jgi:hypothetical protein
MFSDSRLYRARALEPIASINEILLLVDSNGPIRKRGTPFYQVLGVEPIVGFGPHGVLVIYTQGTVAASYTLPAGAPTGNIGASGGTAVYANPTILQNGPSQLTQLRWTIRPLALTGPKEDEIDVQISMGAQGKFGTLNASPGFFNMVDQFEPPMDISDEPAQGANIAPPAATATAYPPPPGPPHDFHNLSEFFIWENNGPTITITNRSSSALSAGTITMRVKGFRYDLANVNPTVLPGWSPQCIMGQSMMAPPVKFTTVPVAPFVGTASFTS